MVRQPGPAALPSIHATTILYFMYICLIQRHIQTFSFSHNTTRDAIAACIFRARLVSTRLVRSSMYNIQNIFPTLYIVYIKQQQEKQQQNTWHAHFPQCLPLYAHKRNARSLACLDRSNIATQRTYIYIEWKITSILTRL